jgi:thymidylate synthase ThyX
MEEILFEKPNFSEEEKYLLEPFFTNLDRSVYAVTFLPPEVIGALSSRASRAKDDLRVIFLNEFVKPFLNTDYGNSFLALRQFLHQHSFEKIFTNPKAREFYLKWLAQYGDDSIAQMAGAHLIYASLSQIAIKHFENQRIGIAPIEKSTRYVDYSQKINNHYLYFDPPEIEKIGLKYEYKKVMNDVFEAYNFLYQKYFDYLKEKFPKEKEIVLKTKVFDTVRIILPLATLSQVSFFANGQAFEYLINRSLDHHLEEIRWAGKRAYEELSKVIPAFLRRIEKEESKAYREYLSKRTKRVEEVLKEINWQKETIKVDDNVKLIEYDPDGENKVLAGLLYFSLKEPFETILARVRKLTLKEKEKILIKILTDRRFRWYKAPRAFENVYLRFEIVLNIGAWRDLQRHRTQTQYHQRFNIFSGFDLPLEFIELNLSQKFKETILKIEDLFQKIEKIDPDIAQYSVSLAHKVRFIQYQNLREFFWEAELRTIPQGHPDYRQIEKQKAKIIQKIYPLISKYLLVDFEDYDFARRESIEKIEKKEKEILK